MLSTLITALLLGKHALDSQKHTEHLALPVWHPCVSRLRAEPHAFMVHQALMSFKDAFHLLLVVFAK